MEKIWGKFILLLIFTSILGCERTPQKSGTLMDFVPEEASIVLKISNWERLQADMENNSLFSKFNKSHPYLFLSEEAPLLKNLHPKSISLLCINATEDSFAAYTFISKQTEAIFQPDSIQDKIIETLEMEDQTFQRITIGKKTSYLAIVDGILVASSSQQILMDILKGKVERNDTFKKIFELPFSGECTALLRNSKLSLTDSAKVNFSSWSALDVSIAPESLHATGITLATDTIPQLLNVFEEQAPQQNNLADIVPADALEAMSFTFDDAEKFQNKLREFRGQKAQNKTSGIFGAVNEVGSFTLKSGQATFIKSIDAALTEDALARFVTIKESFREVEIKSFNEPELFQTTFHPLINTRSAKLTFQLDNFFVFAENDNVAQDIIASYQNNTTLSKSSYFEKTAQDLGSSSSLLFYRMKGKFTGLLLEFLNIKLKEELENISFTEYPLAALQFSFDRNFAHVNMSFREGNSNAPDTHNPVSESFNTTLENPILGRPQIIGDNGNVVVQDIGNKLYYLSESGKILWTKNLGSPILGPIKEVNISGNGNFQMAFATKNEVYVLDRNGKNINSFPLKFKDEITQPLSVFDYDNNHKYRFMVVQDKDVLLYNKDGKTVKGFQFKKAKSTIEQSPVHIKIGKKDYILIPEADGSLNILSRVGKSRISVSKKFDFSEIPISLEDRTFVIITQNGTKERISEDGKISSQSLNVGSNYWFAMNGNTKVTLDDNLLRINGKLAELPLGLYSRPLVFEINQKIFVSITEIQERKVYVFNKNANLLNGFPVYGTSEASLGKSGTAKGIRLAVKGDPKGVIVYNFD